MRTRCNKERNAEGISPRYIRPLKYQNIRRYQMSKKYKKVRKLETTRKALMGLICLLTVSIFGIAGGADMMNISTETIIIETITICIIGALILLLLKNTKKKEQNVRRYIEAHNKVAATKIDKAINEPFLRIVK